MRATHYSTLFKARTLSRGGSGVVCGSCWYFCDRNRIYRCSKYKRKYSAYTTPTQISIQLHNDIARQTTIEFDTNL